MMKRNLTFCFDVCCPYAYLASQKMPGLVAAAKSVGSSDLQVVWKPTLLGGLYEGTNAPQGKAGSATDVMAANKREMLAKDLKREADRLGVTLNWNSKHPVRTLDCLRLLCSIEDMEMRSSVALALYEAYWVRNLDLSNLNIVEDIAAKFGIVNVKERINEPAVKNALKENTDWLVSKGGFGVPSFVVECNGKERLFFGQDRMLFVARALGVCESSKVSQPVHLLNTLTPETHLGTELFFFHDFSSPWSFLGFCDVQDLADSHKAKLVYKPILLGALFRSIGTPNVPMFEMTPARREYGGLDMNDWCQFRGVEMQFPEGFPVRTVLPLRISIVDERTVPVFYKAAWVEGRNIGSEEVIRDVLEKNGFDADKLIEAAGEIQVKDQLRLNTEEAQRLGGCGVPSFRVNSSEIIWGQDRMNVVSDLLASANTMAVARTRSIPASHHGSTPARL